MGFETCCDWVLLAGDAEPGFGTVDGFVAVGDGIDIVSGHGFGIGEGFLRLGAGNVFRKLGALGEDGHLIVEHLCEAGVNEDILRLAVGHIDAKDACAEFAEQGGAVLEDADHAVMRGEYDSRRGGVEHQPLGGDDGTLDGSFFCHKRAFTVLSGLRQGFRPAVEHR